MSKRKASIWVPYNIQHGTNGGWWHRFAAPSKKASRKELNEAWGSTREFRFIRVPLPEVKP